MDELILGSGGARVVEREGTNPSGDRKGVGVGLRISRVVIDRQEASQCAIEIGNLRDSERNDRERHPLRRQRSIVKTHLVLTGMDVVIVEWPIARRLRVQNCVLHAHDFLPISSRLARQVAILSQADNRADQPLEPVDRRGGTLCASSTPSESPMVNTRLAAPCRPRFRGPSRDCVIGEPQG